MENILAQLQEIVIIAAGSAVTALCVYAFSWLRTYLGIKESDSNEAEIRRAAETEAGRLVKLGAIDDPKALLDSAAKVIMDLHSEVKEEGYDTADIKDMILGAAGMIFPPANLLKILK